MATPKKTPAKKPPVPSASKKNKVTSNIPSLIPPKGKPEKRPSRTEPVRSFMSQFGSRRVMPTRELKEFNDRYFPSPTKKKK
jgi:hypothetical protein